MSQPQRPLTPVILKTLAGAAVLGAVAYGVVAVAKATGLLARDPLRLGAAIVVGAIAAMAVVRLLMKLSARREDSNLLDPASELTTLTFPPTRNPRARLQARAK